MNVKLNALVKDMIPPFLFRVMRSLLYRSNASAEKTGAWYDSVYKTSIVYQKHYTESVYYFLWTVLMDRMKHAGVQRILDLGCGAGQFASLVHDHGFPHYCGVDISATAIEIARSKCPDFEFVVSNVLETDLLARQDYDCVVACEFLEHINPDLEIIEKIKPGVRFFGSVPNNPYISHVRYFQDVESVKARYSSFFTDFSVDAFREDAEGIVLYILEGIKA